MCLTGFDRHQCCEHDPDARNSIKQRLRFFRGRRQRAQRSKPEPTTALIATPPAVDPSPPTPPAAAVVATAEVTEESLLLRQQLAARDKALKDRETEIAAVKDEHERYRLAVETPKPVPVRRAPAERTGGFGFLRRRA